MTRIHYILAAFLGSAALLIGAWTFQALGYAPCKMCYWQRYPHMIAVAIGLIALFVPARILLAFGAIAAAVTSGIGFFHAGVEKKWWDGPSDCTGSGKLNGLTGADLLSTDAAGHLVMCDEVAWSFFGISMAGWNGLISAVLCLFWILAARSKT